MPQGITGYACTINLRYSHPCFGVVKNTGYENIPKSYSSSCVVSVDSWAKYKISIRGFALHPKNLSVKIFIMWINIPAQNLFHFSAMVLTPIMGFNLWSHHLFPWRKYCLIKLWNKITKYFVADSQHMLYKLYIVRINALIMWKLVFSFKARQRCLIVKVYSLRANLWGNVISI